MSFNFVEMPIFSVIVPCYNCEATLQRCVASVQAQTFGNFEIILVDDGSTDCTAGIARAIERKDPRVRVIRKANGGAAQARNRAIRVARGELYAFIDADDAWKPTKLAEHHAMHATDPSLDASFARIRFVPEDSQQAITESTVPAGTLSIEQILAENPVCTMSNLVVRRASVDRFGLLRADMTHAEDQEWLARMVSMGGRISGLDKLLVDYRTSAGGLSSDLARMYAGWRAFASTYAGADVLRRAEAVYCRYLARRALRLPGSGIPAFGYATRGLILHTGAFLSDRRRGAATALAAVAAPVIPSPLRQKMFA